MESMTGFDALGRMLIFLGILLVVLGGFVLLLGRLGHIGFGRLPGDIVIQRENFSCFFPLASMILLSILLTIILNLLVRLLGR